MIYLDEQALRTVADWPRMIDVAAESFLALSHGTILAPPRTVEKLPAEGAIYGLMPGVSTDHQLFGTKVVTYVSANPNHGRPALQGLIALFDAGQGTPLAVVDGAFVTLLRTAAASAAATRCLARSDAATLGILGTGAQAAVHIDAIAAVREIEEVIVWGRSLEHAKALVTASAQYPGMRIRVTKDPAEAAAAAIVCTVTSACEPVLFGRWLQPGTHVNLVGAHSATTREMDSEGIRLAEVFVDSRAGAASEAGDLLIPLAEAAIGTDHVRAEVGEVLAGTCKGRATDEQITVFKSLGHVAQDLLCARHLLVEWEEGRRAASGVGSQLG